MLKIITLITKYILVTLAALLFGSCFNYEYKYESDETNIEEAGNYTEQRRNADSDFNKINVSNAILVVIEQSNEPEIIVVADEKSQENVVTEIKNGTLYIYTKSRYNNNVKSKTSFSIFGFTRNIIHNNIRVQKVIVKLAKIEALEANSASRIENKGVLECDFLQLKISSAATMNLNIESDKVEIESSSASTINIKGMALDLDASSSSASTINAGELLVNEVKASASSASNITVHPIVNLDADASSGASIKYNISPKTIEKESSSGGNVHQI